MGGTQMQVSSVSKTTQAPPLETGKGMSRKPEDTLAQIHGGDVFLKPKYQLGKEKEMWIVLMVNWTSNWYFIHKIILYKKKLSKPSKAEVSFSNKFK